MCGGGGQDGGDAAGRGSTSDLPIAEEKKAMRKAAPAEVGPLQHPLRLGNDPQAHERLDGIGARAKEAMSSRSASSSSSTGSSTSSQATRGERPSLKRMVSSVTGSVSTIDHANAEEGATRAADDDDTGKRRRLAEPHSRAPPRSGNQEYGDLPLASLYEEFFDEAPTLLAFVGADGTVLMANRLFVDALALPASPDVIGAAAEAALCPGAASMIRDALQSTSMGSVVRNKEVSFKVPKRLGASRASLGSLSSCSSADSEASASDRGESENADTASASKGACLETSTNDSLEGKCKMMVAKPNPLGLLDAAGSFEKDVRVYVVNASPKFVDGRFRGVRLSLRDVSKQRATAAALRAARQVAEEASKAKSDMMSAVTHEIRTPLVSVLGFSELILDTALTHKQRELVHKITRSGDVLLKLLNNFLDLAKLDADALDLEHSHFKLLEVLQSVHELMSGRAMQKQIRWEVDVQDNVPANVVGDQARLTQILINLISNAIKFTGVDGSITLRVRGLEKTVDDGARPSKQALLRFEVIDTGLGVPKEKAEQIFKPFRQASTSTSRKYGGTGLGLPLSQSLAALFKGRITVDSEPGKGSCFTLEIPLETANANAKLLKPALYKNGLKTFLEDCSDSAAGSISERHPGNVVLTHGIAARGLRVLLVEDTIVNQVIFKAFLEKADVKVDTAADGVEAVDLFKSRPADARYDLILMDLQMPRLDGYGATEEIRALEKAQNLPRTPIIALTACSSGLDLDRCLSSGCDNYIIKPVKGNTLFLAINKTLSLDEGTA